MESKRVASWYHGGVASAMAACCTHPLDLLKVHLQTQQTKSLGLMGMAAKVVKADGIPGLYSGISASVFRQLTYSTVRFAIYEGVKNNLIATDQPMPFYQKVALGGFAGALGGIAGTPGDMVNVRMQNDMKLPTTQRRNYKHIVDGLFRVWRQEGPATLMSGGTMASTRAAFVTIGQLSCYDQFKQLLLKLPVFEDNIITHFSASILAGAVATLLTMPVDVMKTRMMNAPPGQYKGLVDCAKDVGKHGPLGFFKGFMPAFVRLGPHTVLIFVFFEQLRLNFGKKVSC